MSGRNTIPASTRPAASAMAPTTRSWVERNRSGCSTGSAARFSTHQNAARRRAASSSERPNVRGERGYAGNACAVELVEAPDDRRERDRSSAAPPRIERRGPMRRDLAAVAADRARSAGRDRHVDQEQPTPSPLQQQPAEQRAEQERDAEHGTDQTEPVPRCAPGTVSAITALATGKMPPAPKA